MLLKCQKVKKDDVVGLFLGSFMFVLYEYETFTWGSARLIREDWGSEIMLGR